LGADDFGDLISRIDSLRSCRAYDSALTVAHEGLTAARELQTADDSTVALFCHKLGGVSYLLGNLDSARYYWEETLALQERSLGPDHPEVASSLHNLANVYDLFGEVDRAEDYSRRALVIRKSVLGERHPLVGRTLNNLAILMMNQSRLAEAEETFEEALAIMGVNSGGNQTAAQQIRSNLAIVLMRLGKYGKAKVICAESLARLQSIHDPQELVLVPSMNLLALLHINDGEYVPAESLLNESLTITERAAGRSHPNYTYALRTLALLYKRQMRLPEAEQLYGQYVEIIESSPRTDNPNLAIALIELAEIYQDRGDTANLRLVFERSSSLLADFEGVEHTGVAYQLELFAWSFRKYTSALSLDMARRAFDMRWESIRSNSSVLSENNILRYARFMRHSAGLYLSLFFDQGPSLHLADTTVADVIVASKGQVSDAIFQRHRSLVDESDPVVVTLADSLRDVRQKLSQIYGCESVSLGADSIRTLISQLDTKKEKFETRLARLSPSFEEIQNERDISCKRISSLLPDGTCLVEYYKYERVKTTLHKRETHYLALVLSPSRAPSVIDLGPGETIDSLVAEYHLHMDRAIHSTNPGDSVFEREFDRLAAGIYSHIWAPLEKIIDEPSCVFIAPDGELNLVSFASLKYPDDEFFIEKHPIHYLSSARDMVGYSGHESVGTGLLALGDPDYDAPAQERYVADSASSASPVSSSLDVRPVPVHRVEIMRDSPECDDWRSATLERLPGTAREIENVSQAWREKYREPVLRFTGVDALEDCFKKHAGGKRVIHIATHGFFTPADCASDNGSADAVMSAQYVGENPLLFSGLFLAGSNLRGQGATDYGIDDGILTAEEITMLDLRGVDLVTLSACETALGRIESGEGVYGLRRAFLMAGARTVVSALWPVSDGETSDFMSFLYQHDTAPLHTIFREYQINRLKKYRQYGYSDHPSKWAAFIATGDWR
jgi:CHAT domain-containing protein/tetratricopeptide (TPR) repeat protein